MKQHQLIRAVGAVCVVLVYGIYAYNSGINAPVSLPVIGDTHPLVLVLLSEITIISPEVLNKIPFGPTRQ